MQRSFSILAVSAAWLGAALAAAQPVSDPVEPSTPAPTPPTAASAPASPAQPRAQNTWYGSSGGVRVIDGGSGEPGSVRLQLAFDYFSSKEFLLPKDKHRSLSGTLSLGGTPIDHLELFASVGSRSNSNEAGNPILLQTSGDLTLGAKGYLHVLPWLDAGVDLRALVLNSIGELGVKGSATSVGVRAAASADLRKAASLPLIVRVNVGYLLDNSSKLIESTEHARYNALPAATRREARNEDRNLINRSERFGLGINRVDMLGFGLGLEAPFELASELFVSPLIEWQLGVPVNRQSYDCLSVPTDANVKSSDGCLAVAGLAAAPSTLTFGARVQPHVTGLSALLAFDIGLLGTTKFVREIAPNRPWALLLALGYAIDTRKPAPEIRYVERAVAASPPPQVVEVRARIRGTVVERGSGVSVIGAVVRYPDRDLSPQLTGAEGTFTSYALPAGEVQLEITHPDYEPGGCVVQLTAAAPAHAARLAPRSGLAPAGAAPAASAAPVLAADGSSGLVQARCELTARPRNGRIAGNVTDEHGRPLTGIAVELSGPAARSVMTGAGGELAAADLPPGEYSARVDAKDYLFKSQALSVSAGKESSLNLSLVSRPKVSQVLLTSREVKIGTQVVFTPSSADIDPRSTGLLSEVADVLARNPQVKRVQVQGHTDNRGDPTQNRELSQRRAEAVAQWLVNAGVDPARLEAKGFGDEQPLAPNITAENRARNRRVQFVILKK
jgi:OOP family OmpA-OmpF porin